MAEKNVDYIYVNTPVWTGRDIVQNAPWMDAARSAEGILSQLDSVLGEFGGIGFSSQLGALEQVTDGFKILENVRLNLPALITECIDKPLNEFLKNANIQFGQMPYDNIKRYNGSGVTSVDGKVKVLNATGRPRKEKVAKRQCINNFLDAARDVMDIDKIMREKHRPDLMICGGLAEDVTKFNLKDVLNGIKETLYNNSLELAKEEASVRNDRERLFEEYCKNNNRNNICSIHQETSIKVSNAVYSYSDELIDFVKEHEALRLYSYNDGKTIGYGFDIENFPAIEIQYNSDGSISESEAERLLKIVLDANEKELNEYLLEEDLFLNQYAYDVAMDLVYNRGMNSITKEAISYMGNDMDIEFQECLKNLDYRYAEEILYKKYEDVEMRKNEARAYIDRNPGLHDRRQDEINVYLYGYGEKNE